MDHGQRCWDVDEIKSMYSCTWDKLVENAGSVDLKGFEP